MGCPLEFYFYFSDFLFSDRLFSVCSLRAGTGPVGSPMAHEQGRASQDLEPVRGQEGQEFEIRNWPSSGQDRISNLAKRRSVNTVHDLYLAERRSDPERDPEIDPEIGAK